MFKKVHEQGAYPVNTPNNATDRFTTLDELFIALTNSLAPSEEKNLIKLYERVKRALKSNDENEQYRILLKFKSKLLLLVDIESSEQTENVMKLVNYINDYFATQTQRKNRMLGLPDEILIYIFSLLDRDQQQTLAFVCQRLYAISQDSTLLSSRYPTLNYAIKPKLATIRFQNTCPTCVSVLSPRNIIIGCENGAIYIWDVLDNRHKLALLGHTARINCFLILPDNRIISASDDHTLRVWNQQAQESLLTLEGHEDAVTHIDSVRENVIVSGSKDCRLILWNVDTGECLRVLAKLWSSVKSLAFITPKFLICGDVSLTLMDIDTGKRIPHCSNSVGAISLIRSLATNEIITGTDSGEIHLWDNELNYIKKMKERDFLSVCSIDILPSGNIVTASSLFIEIWDHFTKEKIFTIEASRENILKGNKIVKAKILENGYIASLHHDKTLSIWNLETGECVQTLKALSKIEDSNKILQVLPNGFVINSVAPNILGIWQFPSLYYSYNHMKKYLFNNCFELIKKDILEHFNYELNHPQVVNLFQQFHSDRINTIFKYYSNCKYIHRQKKQARFEDHLMGIMAPCMIYSFFCPVIGFVIGFFMLLVPVTRIYSLIPFSISLINWFVILPIAFLCCCKLHKKTHDIIPGLTYWETHQSSPLITELNKYQQEDGTNEILETIILTAKTETSTAPNKSQQMIQLFSNCFSFLRYNRYIQSAEYINVNQDLETDILPSDSEYTSETDNADIFLLAEKAKFV